MQNVKQLGNLAPRPSRRSKARALYDAIAGNGGAATLGEIVQLLPATDDCDKWSTLNATQVAVDLRSPIYHGYLVHDSIRGIWKIAPSDYYEKRQAVMKDQLEHRSPPSSPGHKTPEDPPRFILETDEEVRKGDVVVNVYGLVKVLAIFAIGVVTGYLVALI